ncbi:hypothetical protein Sjap_022201 [Stephania japonica]|uniref:Uncharacterized protein n=1 Tax=Stephania japonica TaxID=461633 RepID=A0AAP0HSK4_9MAGN
MQEGGLFQCPKSKSPSIDALTLLDSRSALEKREERWGREREEEEEASCGSESGGEKVTCKRETSCEREGDEEINSWGVVLFGLGFRAQGDGSEPRERGNQEEVLRKRNQEWRERGSARVNSLAREG